MDHLFAAGHPGSLHRQGLIGLVLCQRAAARFDHFFAEFLSVVSESVDFVAAVPRSATDCLDRIRGRRFFDLRLVVPLVDHWDRDAGEELPPLAVADLEVARLIHSPHDSEQHAFLQFMSVLPQKAVEDIHVDLVCLAFVEVRTAARRQHLLEDRLESDVVPLLRKIFDLGENPMLQFHFSFDDVAERFLLFALQPLALLESTVERAILDFAQELAALARHDHLLELLDVPFAVSVTVVEANQCSNTALGDLRPALEQVISQALCIDKAFGVTLKPLERAPQVEILDGAEDLAKRLQLAFNLTDVYEQVFESPQAYMTHHFKLLPI